MTSLFSWLLSGCSRGLLWSHQPQSWVLPVQRSTCPTSRLHTNLLQLLPHISQGAWMPKHCALAFCWCLALVCEHKINESAMFIHRCLYWFTVGVGRKGLNQMVFSWSCLEKESDVLKKNYIKKRKKLGPVYECVSFAITINENKWSRTFNLVNTGTDEMEGAVFEVWFRQSSVFLLFVC